MLAFFGVVTIQIGYETLRRGSIKYTPEDGPAEILSPEHGAAAFWTLSAGMCAVGALVLLAGPYVLFRSIGAVRRVAFTAVADNRMVPLEASACVRFCRGTVRQPISFRPWGTLLSSPFNSCAIVTFL